MKKLFALMLMAASVLFIACEDEGKDPLSAQEAQEVLGTLPAEIGTEMGRLTDAEGIDVMGLLMNTPYPFAAQTPTKSTSIASQSSMLFNINKFLLPQNYLNKQLVASTKVVEPNFDFENWKGVYTWNNDAQKWDVTWGGSVIELNFPSDSAALSVNDAKLTIYSYTETLITYTEDTYIDMWYQPTAMHADLVVGGVELIDVLFSAEWVVSGSNAGEPASLDATVYLIPFQFTGTFDHTGTSAEIDFAIKYDGTTIFGAGLDATFATVEMNDPVKIGGYIKFMDVKLKGQVDILGIETLMTNMNSETPTITDPQQFVDALNNEFSAAIYVSGAKAADIEIALNTAAVGEDMPIHIVFVFSDGTTQPALPTLIAIGNELENFFMFLDGIYLK